ncbi:MAG: hypothetical protein JW717_08395 [Marinilabiliaceae bacterium]|nr:hypothetical protein [Marinilabiliaceae bacterium]
MFSKRLKEDKTVLKAWLDNGLKLPPPDAVKYQKIIDRKKKRNIKTIFTTENYLNKRNWALKKDFKTVLNIDQLDQRNSEKAIIWLDFGDENFQKIPDLIDNSFKSIEKPDILIDGAIRFMQHNKHPNLWDLKLKVTTEHPGYFFHTHNDIIIISPSL